LVHPLSGLPSRPIVGVRTAGTGLMLGLVIPSPMGDRGDGHDQ
jgi:hypothetical protein